MINNKELICTYRTPGNLVDLVNDLTREMDEYLIKGTGKLVSSIYKTYIMYNPIIDKDDKVYCIRVPGATRGGIFVDDNNVIIKIELIEDTCFKIFQCYNKDVLNILDKYIGYKLIFPESNKE